MSFSNQRPFRIGAFFEAAANDFAADQLQIVVDIGGPEYCCGLPQVANHQEHQVITLQESEIDELSRYQGCKIAAAMQGYNRYTSVYAELFECSVCLNSIIIRALSDYYG